MDNLLPAFRPPARVSRRPLRRTRMDLGRGVFPDTPPQRTSSNGGGGSGSTFSHRQSDPTIAGSRRSIWQAKTRPRIMSTHDPPSPYRAGESPLSTKWVRKGVAGHKQTHTLLTPVCQSSVPAHLLGLLRDTALPRLQMMALGAPLWTHPSPLQTCRRCPLHASSTQQGSTAGRLTTVTQLVPLMARHCSTHPRMLLTLGSARALARPPMHSEHTVSRQHHGQVARRLRLPQCDTLTWHTRYKASPTRHHTVLATAKSVP